jgi:phosphodiesterase/alkaline phosphatase D-like protein
MPILTPAKFVVLLALLFSKVTTGKSSISSLEPELVGIRVASAFAEASPFLRNAARMENRQGDSKSDVALAMQPAGTSDKNTPTFTGVAAGDVTSNSAILWTRTFDPGSKNGMAARLKVEVSTDVNFTTIPFTATVTTNPNRDYTVKVEATKLQSGIRYYYRFGIPKGGFSAVGTFKTAPNPTSSVPVRFGFSGDADGQWRPYSSTVNFDRLKLDYFVFLGDTMYETASKGSPATADPVANPAQALTDYRRKYLENIQAINPDGFAGLQTLYRSQGNYTLLDNHELGNKQLINGGASAVLATTLGNGSSNSVEDVNKTGTFINQTTGFKTLLRAYSEYQPIREKIVSAPGDKRTDRTQQLYFAQQWGRNTIFVNVDTRSYRDVRLKTLKGGDDTGVRADNPDRTMLGKTQLAWLKQTLLNAQKNGTTWKFIAISSPIDTLGAVGSGEDGGKSWSGGYRAERNNLLKFIADNGIKNTVFLSTDDHQNRVNEITYLDNIKDPKTLRVLPAALAIVDGPIGAGGPDLITNHSFNYLKNIADTIAQKQLRAGVNPIGLDPKFPGLRNVIREGDSQADKLRQPIDFYSPDTFNYAILDVSADGKTLSVNVQGINSSPKGTFPEPSTANPVRSILSFKIDRS